MVLNRHSCLFRSLESLALQSQRGLSLIQFRRSAREFVWPLSVLRGLLDMVNNNDFHGAFGRVELQPQLFLKRGKDRRPRCVGKRTVVGWRAATTWRLEQRHLIFIGRPLNAEVVVAL